MTYPPHNPDDEPRSEPFQPVSYDLAPEFGTPPPPSAQPGNPAQSGYGAQPGSPAQSGHGTQPGYPAQPGHGTQPGFPAQSGYRAQPAPAYPVSAQPHAYQPVSAPPPAFTPAAPLPPPAPPKKGKGLKITLSVIGGVFLVCAIATTVFLYPYIKETAHVSAPATLPGGLKKSDTDAAGQLEDTLETALRDGTEDLNEVATGVYTTDDDVEKVVVLAAATGTFLSPGSEADSAFTGFSTGGSGQRDVGTARVYDAGSLGGTVKCADGEAGSDSDKTTFAMCVWADHGSIGLVLFFSRTADESAPLFVQIREAVVKR
ncbi:hypothetical protein GCM10022255_083130 [Dactylosporangium darangshiense]|uniref:Uncharacterized protein n=1 Tax=Dactylosporangium darangshiense TaxID=579108 RepID=A0ABP8DLU3_9ACTN